MIEIIKLLLLAVALGFAIGLGVRLGMGAPQMFVTFLRGFRSGWTMRKRGYQRIIAHRSSPR